MITKPLAYQASFLNDLFKRKCQTKFIKITQYVILHINVFIQDMGIITLAYPGMQMHQLWTNFPDIILAFDVSTCIRIMIKVVIITNLRQKQKSA